MKASELVYRLQLEIEAHGDLTVYHGDMEEWTMEDVEVCQSETDEAHQYIHIGGW